MKSRWLLAVLAVLLAHLAIAAEAKKVLVIYPNSRLLPANIAFDSGLHQATAASPGQPIEVFSEFLDEPQFGGGRPSFTVSTYLHEKYADRPPDAILVGGGDRLEVHSCATATGYFPRCPLCTPPCRDQHCNRYLRFHPMSSACLSRTTMPAPSSRHSNRILVQGISS